MGRSPDQASVPVSHFGVTASGLSNQAQRLEGYWHGQPGVLG